MTKLTLKAIRVGWPDGRTDPKSVKALLFLYVKFVQKKTLKA